MRDDQAASLEVGDFVRGRLSNITWVVLESPIKNRLKVIALRDLSNTAVQSSYHHEPGWLEYQGRILGTCVFDSFQKRLGKAV